jgi:hypothetical protein
MVNAMLPPRLINPIYRMYKFRLTILTYN